MGGVEFVCVLWFMSWAAGVTYVLWFCFLQVCGFCIDFELF